MNMIEKVARAIHARSHKELSYEGDCIPLAKTAIEAMIEPTEGMCFTAKYCYQAMIEAALKQ